MAYGERLDVTEEDVEICLGLPRGRILVERTLPSEQRTVAKKWREHIGKEEYLIRPGHVVDAMMCTEDVNQFIRDFIILFYSCVIEPTQSGAANQNLILPLREMSRISQYNWCGFVIKCLNDAKEKWDSNPTASFIGPLLFLTVSYCTFF